jgi:hypothetical protein
VTARDELANELGGKAAEIIADAILAEHAREMAFRIRATLAHHPLATADHAQGALWAATLIDHGVDSD